MEKRFRNSLIYSCILLLLLIAGLLSACNKMNEQPKKSEQGSETTSSPFIPESSTTVAPTTGSLDLRTAIIQVAKETIPAVAHIEVTERQTVPNPFFPFGNDPFFQFFFNLPKEPREYKRELKGLGSGIIFDSAGHIITNNHVAGGATKINVLLNNGKTYPAKLIGADPKTDIAVIKIEAKESLPTATFGDSDKVQVGEWVVAIGQPRGLDQSVTQGIISAKHRTGITDPSTYQDFLQTDAAINPGNSGGPLLNLAGQVIGINTAIMSQSGGFEGLGFAIPSNMVLHVAKALIAHGKVERGWLGVSVQDLTPDLAQSFGLKDTKGALVADVIKGSPADKAGIKRGDVIVSFEGKETLDASTLRNEVANIPIGKQVTFTIWRDKKRENLTVTIGNLESAVKLETLSLKERLGGEFRAVTSSDVEKYNLESQSGVVITRVYPNGALAEAGLEVGDIILAINDQNIDGLGSFTALVNTIKPHQRVRVLALDHRTGQTWYVLMKLA
jgi:serine protease Do